MKSNYHEKRQARIDRFKDLAADKAKLSVSAWERSSEIASWIPMGQPILIGHHSEGRHRRDLAKIDNAMRKSVEAQQSAAYYAERAQAAESNTAISSDNPDALVLLQEKLAGLQQLQEIWKQVNKIMRAKKTNPEKVADIIALGVPEEYAQKFVTGDRFGRVGVPSYKLTNNNGNMARIKDRIEHLKKLEAMEDKDIEIAGVRILASAATNRVQIFFPGKPADQVRADLKSDGFRWAPTEGAWQKNLSSWAERQASTIVERHYSQPNTV